MAQGQRGSEHRINDRIRASRVRVVGPEGEQIGIMRTNEAVRQAQETGYDLVEVAPGADPPVCKIMDYGKFKYQESIRAKEARKKQASQTIKEIKFRPKISTHDYETKKGHVERFLKGGHKVKVTVMFRGREMAHTDLGRKLLDRLTEDLEGLANAETGSRLDGRNMHMMFAPSAKK